MACISNYQTLMLGAISANFRMVSLTPLNGSWKVSFFIEKESAEDRDEIYDSASEFEALPDSSISYEVEMVVGNEEIAWPEPPTMVIFRHRES